MSGSRLNHADEWSNQLRQALVADADLELLDVLSNKPQGMDLPANALLLAARLGRARATTALLDHNADVNAQSAQRGRQALHIAAFGGHTAVVRVLLAQGNAAVNATDKAHATALHMAARKGYDTLANLLLESKANPNIVANNGSTPLWEAIQHNHVKVARLLLRHGAKSKPSDEAKSAVHAVLGNRLGGELLSSLIGCNASIDETDESFVSPLSRALRCTSRIALLLLLQHKADPNATSPRPAGFYSANFQRYQRTWTPPLEEALKLCQPDIVRLLLDFKADPNVPVQTHPQTDPQWRETALYWLTDDGRYAEAQMLCEAGASVNATFDHATPLQTALSCGRLNFVRLLLKWGADVAVSPRHQPSPIALATTTDPKALSILRQHGKDLYVLLRRQCLRALAPELLVIVLLYLVPRDLIPKYHIADTQDVDEVEWEMTSSSEEEEEEEEDSAADSDCSYPQL